MARCQCLQDCSCFLLDDGYNGFNIDNNSTTLVRGDGTAGRPYYVQDINGQSFVPPAARVRTATPIASGAGVTVSFEIVDSNVENMYNPNTPTRLAITHPGIYLVGFSVAWNAVVAGTTLRAGVVSQGGFEFRTGELSDGTAMTTTGSGIVLLGLTDFLSLELEGPGMPGASAAMLWAVYT